MSAAKKNENKITLGFNPEIPIHDFAIKTLNGLSRKKADLAARAIWAYFNGGQGVPRETEALEAKGVSGIEHQSKGFAVNSKVSKANRHGLDDSAEGILEDFKIL